MSVFSEIVAAILRIDVCLSAARMAGTTWPANNDILSDISDDAETLLDIALRNAFF
jgi:hypothetical protein